MTFGIERFNSGSNAWTAVSGRTYDTLVGVHSARAEFGNILNGTHGNKEHRVIDKSNGDKYYVCWYVDGKYADNFDFYRQADLDSGEVTDHEGTHYTIKSRTQFTYSLSVTTSPPP